MKKILSLVLAAMMLLGLCSIASADAADFDPELVAAAQAEGELIVYGSCEEEYLSAACKHFEELFGIKVSYQRLSGGEVQSKLEEEAGNPSGDAWFGGASDPYAVAASEGLLEAYDAKNAVHLTNASYKDPNGCWYGIYKGILGFMCNKEELDRLGLAVPQDWDDLLKPEYKGLIWSSNPATASTARVLINTIVQMRGEEKALEYFAALNENVAQYTKSGSGPSKNVGTGECVIGIGFLHDGIYQILQGYDNIVLVIPSSGTAYEIGGVAIFKGAKHPNAAKLFVEYALSPDCVELGKDNGSYQFLVLDNAQQPPQATEFGLDPENVIDYDFEDAKANISKYIEDFFAKIQSDDRFKTE